jgi:endosialidase-like protein
MRTIYSGLAAVVIGVVWSNAATAQSPVSQVSVPRVITVTGVFQPVDGQPPQAVETVTLAVYAEQVGGAPLWQETQTITLDARGRYSLLLGATLADGIPAAVLAAGAEWLGLRFDRPGEVEGPRARLTSVPYSLRAADADTLGGHPASAYLLAPTAGSAESSAVRPASESRANASTAATPNAVLPGTDSFVAKYVGTADVGPSAIYEAAGTGNVGIGTTNPLDSLHVRFTNPGGTATGYAVQNLSGAANAYSGMLFYDQNGVLGQFQGFNNTTHEYRINNVAKNVSNQFNGSINFMTGGTSRFLVTTPGNIGIGTTAPAALLDVSNALLPTSAISNIFTTSYGANNFGSVIAGRKARGTALAPAAVQNGDALSIWGGSGYGTTGFNPIFSGISVMAGENWTDTAQATNMNFTTTPTGTTQPVVRMWIVSNGNVGIGTQFGAAGSLEVSNATTNFTFANTVTTSYTGTNTGGSIFSGRKARGTAAAPSAVQNGDTLAGFLAQGYGSTGFSATRGGMFVRAAETWTDAAQGTSLAFNTTAAGTNTPNTKMTIDSFGGVGIGTTVPQASLELSRTGTEAFMLSSIYANGNTDATAGYSTRFANGTPAAPTAVQSGNILGAWIASGYGATQFSDVNGGMGVIAQENWTDTAQGTLTGFLATPLGSTTPHVYMSVMPSGNVGIGDWPLPTPVPTAADKLQVFGDVRVGDAGTNGCLKRFDGNFLVGTCVSDRRFKKNITPFGRVLDQLSALQPVNYYWRAAEYPGRHFGDAQAYGLIAQDVEQVLPELVVTNDDGYKAVDYTKLPLLTIQAVKELKSENDALKERVADLERLVTQLLATTARQ